jgi:hypothetical protein
LFENWECRVNVLEVSGPALAKAHKHNRSFPRTHRSSSSSAYDLRICIRISFCCLPGFSAIANPGLCRGTFRYTIGLFAGALLPASEVAWEDMYRSRILISSEITGLATIESSGLERF